jgi:hypothetical protein
LNEVVAGLESDIATWKQKEAGWSADKAGFEVQVAKLNA